MTVGTIWIDGEDESSFYLNHWLNFTLTYEMSPLSAGMLIDIDLEKLQAYLIMRMPRIQSVALACFFISCYCELLLDVVKMLFGWNL